MNTNLKLELFLMMTLVIGYSFGCFRTGDDWYRRNALNSHVLLMNEKVPNKRENDRGASGPILEQDYVWENEKEKSLVRMEEQEPFSFQSESARWMTPECRVSLLALGDAVMNRWPNKDMVVFVLKAWENPPELYRKNATIRGVRGHYRFMSEELVNGHLREQYHYAGQAVNMLLTRKKNRKKEKNMTLGVLGQMAFFKAQFTSCFYSEHRFIHCSVKKRQTGFGCFTAGSKVQVQGRGSVEMKNIRRGDLVKSVSNDGKVVFSPVVLFLHREVNLLSEFITIEVESGQRLSVTKNHLIYRVTHNNNNNELSGRFWDRKVAIFANKISPGDAVIVRDFQNNLSIKRVVNVTKAFIQKGVYSPLTEEGRIIVGDIVASSYSQIADENIARMAFKPYIMWSSMLSNLHSMVRKKPLPPAEYNEDVKSGIMRDWRDSSDGVHWYARFLWSMSEYVIPRRLMYSR